MAKVGWVAFEVSCLLACGTKNDAHGDDMTGGTGGALGTGGSAPNAMATGSGGSSVTSGSGGSKPQSGSGGSASAGQNPGSGGASSSHADSGTPGAMHDGGEGGASAAGDCTREFLKSTIDGYFSALAAHDASMLPQASSVRFTENAKDAQLGEGLVWKTAGMVKFTRSALDTERCGSVTEAVIPNSGKDTIYGLRLQIVDQQIDEIETIVVDPDNGFFPTPEGILNSTGDAWEDIVPEDKRSTRDELEAAGKAYFASFGDQSVKPPYAMPCDRLENGFKTTQGDCSNFGGAVGLNQPEQRYPVTDLEAGITAGFILFAGADIDFHMFKMSDHEILWINAVVGPAVSSQGWP
jgi:hypothetical protein